MKFSPKFKVFSKIISAVVIAFVIVPLGGTYAQEASQESEGGGVTPKAALGLEVDLDGSNTQAKLVSPSAHDTLEKTNLAFEASDAANRVTQAAQASTPMESSLDASSCAPLYREAHELNEQAVLAHEAALKLYPEDSSEYETHSKEVKRQKDTARENLEKLRAEQTHRAELFSESADRESQTAQSKSLEESRYSFDHWYAAERHDRAASEHAATAQIYPLGSSEHESHRQATSRHIQLAQEHAQKSTEGARLHAAQLSHAADEETQSAAEGVNPPLSEHAADLHQVASQAHAVAARRFSPETTDYKFHTQEAKRHANAHEAYLAKREIADQTMTAIHLSVLANRKAQYEQDLKSPLEQLEGSITASIEHRRALEAHRTALKNYIENSPGYRFHKWEAARLSKIVEPKESKLD